MEIANYDVEVNGIRYRVALTDAGRPLGVFRRPKNPLHREVGIAIYGPTGRTAVQRARARQEGTR